MYHFKKHYTLDEARALLPTLREIFASIHKHKAALEKAEETSSKELERTGGDVGGKSVQQLVQSMTGLQEKVAQIVQMGIQVKDLDRGLIDFPSLRDGHEVFLCWELEEDDIEFWHDVEAGYAGRERL
jgi:hypothetical protein